MNVKSYNLRKLLDLIINQIFKFINYLNNYIERCCLQYNYEITRSHMILMHQHVSSRFFNITVKIH